MTRRNSPPLTMSNPLPRLARTRSTARLELDFTAKQMRWSSGAQRVVQVLEMTGQRLLRINVKRRAVLLRQRLHGDSFAKQRCRSGNEMNA